MLSVPDVRFRALDTTTPWISKFVLSHLKRCNGLYARLSGLNRHLADSLCLQLFFQDFNLAGLAQHYQDVAGQQA